MADNDAPAAAPKKSKLKLILLLTTVVVLAIGLSIAGTLWFLNGADDDVEMPVEAAEVVFEPSQYYVIDKPLVATLKSEGRQRYVQVHIALEATDSVALDAANKHLPLLRSRLLSVLGSKSFQEIQTVAGRDQLIGDLLTTVNQVLEREGEPPVQSILFRNYVLQ
ncbi:flagellar basal body-associated FliL family protein [Marinobacter caseinilyticus]|uniref:flagellar basal body-associated FliL family protein n=1 Tax=Marinobacter caseinilyticus TaxID=2692195 RepID=UPI00140B52C5|nr:flagellar basal body-associated FliL family protein [Marinobacter caseinilyticus]